MSYLDFQLLSMCRRSSMSLAVPFTSRYLRHNRSMAGTKGRRTGALSAIIAGTKLVLLTQENPFPTSGAVHFQLQVPTGGYLPPGAGSRCRHPGAFLPPLRLAYVPHGGSGGKSHQYLYGANHRRIKRTETVKIKGCSSLPELKREAAYETEPFRKPPPFFRF